MTEEFRRELINSKKNVLQHHGIDGMKWGKRYGPPYPLTSDAKKQKEYDKKINKALSGTKAVTINAGNSFQRISANNNDNTKSNNITYVTVGKKDNSKYVVRLGAFNLEENGKAYVQRYEAVHDIRIPDLKTQLKIEKSLLNDKDVQREVIESLMKKGLSRQQAAKEVTIINKGKEYAKNVFATAAIFGGMYGLIGGLAAGGLGAITGLAGGGIFGALMRAPAIMSSVKPRDEYQSAIISNSLADINNVKLRSAYIEKLAAKGYNAFRDYNDRNNSMRATSAIVITDSDRNLKLQSSKKLTADEYAKQYAEFQYNKLNSKQKELIFKEDYEAEGKRIYAEALDNHYKDRGKSA